MSIDYRAVAAPSRALTALLLLAFATAAPAQPLLIEDAWVRAMPPTQRMTAAYMTLRNSGDEPVVVLGVSAADAADASLHTTRREGDRVRMEALGELEVPAGGTYVLRPGAAHVMLMGLERMPAAGEDMELCLQTSAGELCAAVPVQRSADAGGEP